MDIYRIRVTADGEVKTQNLRILFKNAYGIYATDEKDVSVIPHEMVFHNLDQDAMMRKLVYMMPTEIFEVYFTTIADAHEFAKLANSYASIWFIEAQIFAEKEIIAKLNMRIGECKGRIGELRKKLKKAYEVMNNE